ncbi:AAEL010518-PA, partial [Aedes aegypti]
GPHHHHPVYLEAPEPIIEIIIKESNDSTLYEQQSVVPSQKKKKEEVQVFYVKYHKDDKHGIVLDTPIPALKPLPDESEEEVDESSLHEEPIVVTPSPPQKTTTLRAIINPDSEKYHSNSGIRISFGVEDKHQSGHQISETESESVAQPVVALPQGHVLPQPQAQTQPQHQAVHQQSQPQLHHQHHSSQHKADQFYQQHQQFLQQRSFPTPVPFASQPQYHQQAPQPHQSFVQNFGQSTAVPQYRAQPQYQYQQYQPQSHRFQQFDQSRNFAQPQQQFRAPVAQPQQYVQQPRQQVHFNAPVTSQPQSPPQTQAQPQFFPQPQQLRQPQPQDYQQQAAQPKPIPIPLHNINNQPPLRHQYSPAPQQNQFNQPFNNFHKHQQTLQPPKPSIHNLPPPPPPQPQPQPQPPRFQDNNFPAIRGNFVESPRPVQGGLVQQAAPNLSTTRTPNYPTSAADHQNNLRNILPAGGELVQSVPKYESHITEHIKSDGQKQSFLSTPTFNIQPSQELISHSVAPQFENAVPKDYAQSTAPSPSTPQQYISKPLPTPQIIPNSEPINQSLRVANQVAHLINVSPRNNFQSQQSQPQESQPQQSHPQQQRPQPAHQTNFVWNGGATFASSTTTQRPTTTTTTPASAVISEKKQKAILDLPAEVPDDIRQHLLSSGILDNADISVLDYDKLGETSLDNLPPEHLANFFSSGGASQLAGSSNVVSVVKPNGEKVAEKFISKNYDQPQETMPEKQNVDLKVVRFDSSSQKNVTDRYIKHDSTILPSVDQNDEQSYNRYLPLKINGAQFPIPDVAELRGRRISSVVVLAPVDNIMPNKNFVINAEAEGSVVSGEEEPDQPRFERDTLLDSQKVKFIAGEALKQLIKKPSTENFKRWLEREGKTDIDLQSVVLLVTRNENDDQEIFMYDIGTKAVTHLNGELSQAFVKVAEENAQTQNLEELPVVDSGIVEQMGAGAKDRQSEEASSYEEDADLEAESDEQAEASEQKPIYVYPINSKYRRVQINSGYSNIKN